MSRFKTAPGQRLKVGRAVLCGKEGAAARCVSQHRGYHGTQDRL